MPRPQNKIDLIQAGHDNFAKMFALINEFDEQEILNRQIPFADRDKNIRDILVHLHHWHLMFLDWYKIGMQGEKPDMPAKGHTWRTLPALNQEIWQQYQQTDYQTAKTLLEDSFQDVQSIIQKHNNEELFSKKRYHWTGSTSLGAYLVSATSSHYDRAIKKLKKYKKHLKV